MEALIILSILIIIITATVLGETTEFSVKKIAIICMIVITGFYSLLLAAYFFDAKKFSDELVLNEKILSLPVEFNIIQDDAFFTSKNAKLIFSDHQQNDDASFHVKNLYQSTTSNEFFWYSYSITQGHITDELILPDEPANIKKVLLKKSKPLYLEIFGQPAQY